MLLWDFFPKGKRNFRRLFLSSSSRLDESVELVSSTWVSPCVVVVMVADWAAVVDGLIDGCCLSCSDCCCCCWSEPALDFVMNGGAEEWLPVSMSGSWSPAPDATDAAAVAAAVMSWSDRKLSAALAAVPQLKSKICCWSCWSCCATVVAAGDDIAG